MATEQPTFEELRADLAHAPSAQVADERTVIWVGKDQKLAYARNDRSELEVFLMGQELNARERIVKERLLFDDWARTGGSALSANRLWLPAGEHYDAIAATVLIELVGNGYEHDPDRAFARTEPLIALVLGRAKAENAALTGLAGELLTLAALIRASDGPAEATLDSWQGWGRSSRDFQLGPVGLEVKTTTTSASRHHIQGWYQVECGIAADGTVETSLYLLSIGIQWLNDESRGASIETLTQEVLASLPAHRHQGFVDCVRTYSGLKLEIDGEGRAGQTSLRRPFISTFERLYDMQDERIQVPRASDFAAFGDLVSDSVSFEIELPERVRGDRNPGRMKDLNLLVSQ